MLGSCQTKGSLDNLSKPLYPPPLFLCPQGGIDKLCQQCKEGLFCGLCRLTETKVEQTPVQASRRKAYCYYVVAAEIL